VEYQETLETGTVVGQLANTVEYVVDNFLSDGVVTTGVVVGGIFLSSDELFWVEELSVCSGTDFVNDSWLKIDEDSSRNVLSGSSLREESVE